MYVQKQWQTDRYHPFYYVEYLPKDYDPTKEYPLVFFLHGAGERVQDPHEAMRHGYMKYVREQGKEYPFIFIAPQCIGNNYWASFTESLSAFLDYILDTYPIDRSRVYLTGLSMGGTGTWMFAMAKPDTFAALMPVNKMKIATKIPIQPSTLNEKALTVIEESKTSEVATQSLRESAAEALSAVDWIRAPIFL